VADVVADVLQGEMGVQQALHKAVPQYMRTGAWHTNAGFADEMGGARDHRRGANRGERSAVAHEHLAARRGWPSVLEVINDRCSHYCRERISGGIACFSLANLEPFVAPVDVIERERGDPAARSP
jgi:hypothetical protein